ncbi:2-succinyl-5-enolpyruvyl-6-hydroxy-3-cyclohexene-1-carboxylic-acid synthase [Muriicola jejuensis]|uniref:2-succinyl-5-enolpyruvyl-6-hydroxy-3- cyclohexene-1-carboxylic-acid synthase n=1 Tax=Muriicola jejuensis TaxID=504488 RepID=UPI00293B9A74|nr:2-succinyl-5-enolpyruvyl-6-hydroxy-3-cyclohexene-1-carboxylic-acid synthase [Muriicola jejuensis]
MVQYCKALGISQVVISPGSRNAPLIIGFTEDPFFTCYSIVDERSAAFFAIGLTQQLRHPVIVLCTSGSALLNYYPAIAEAFYSDHPLLVISADRPPYKIDIGDGQTIRQDHVFHRHIGYSANLKLDVSHATNTVSAYEPEKFREGIPVEELQREIDTFNREEISRAMEALFTRSLPAHINIPFEEPLYNTVDDHWFDLTDVRQPQKEEEDLGDLSVYQEKWSRAGRKMVLVGVMPEGTLDSRWLEELASDPSVLIFTETTSNLNHPNIIPSIDSIIAPIEKSNRRVEKFQELQPDILLTFGGLVVSKKIKAFLRTYKPKHHWHVHENKAYDTFFALDRHFRCLPNTFMKSFVQGIERGRGNYQENWLRVRDRYVQKREEYLKQIPFTDMWAFDKVLRSLPKGVMVQLANSSTVRYAQLFDMGKHQAVHCNRGTSGIDGSTSTAAGAAIHFKEPTVLITGDLSFFYDINGLWNQYLRPDFRVVLVNNGGGGIFRILPGKEDSPNFKTYFETSHDLNAKSVCELHGLQYRVATGKEELMTALDDFFKPSDRPVVLEIKTPAELNDRILLSYFDFLS